MPAVQLSIGRVPVANWPSPLTLVENGTSVLMPPLNGKKSSGSAITALGWATATGVVLAVVLTRPSWRISAARSSAARPSTFIAMTYVSLSCGWEWALSTVPPRQPSASCQDSYTSALSAASAPTTPPPTVTKSPGGTTTWLDRCFPSGSVSRWVDRRFQTPVVSSPEASVVYPTSAAPGDGPLPARLTVQLWVLPSANEITQNDDESVSVVEKVTVPGDWLFGNERCAIMHGPSSARHAATPWYVVCPFCVVGASS